MLRTRLILTLRYRALAFLLGTFVVDEDITRSGVDIEVVVVAARDGEVPHPAVTLLRDPAPSGYGRISPVWGAQVGAVPESPRHDPPTARPAGTGTKDEWLLLVSITDVFDPTRTFRSYRSVSWWTSTAATDSA